MFSMHPLRGRSDWYYEQVASGREDYYAECGAADDSAGRWLGAGADRLGLSGAVAPGQLGAMSDGRHPTDGSLLLTRRSRLMKWTRRGPNARATVAESVTGYDLTFSAPKSASVLYAVGDADTSQPVRAAHDLAVRDAVGYLEREACVTRRGKRGALRLRGDGFVAAAYRHVASRARDPQVHTHVVVGNMTAADGRWTRLDGATLYRHGKTAGYLYQASLRLRLTEALGVEWTAVRNGHAEIIGVPEGVLAEFSQRRRAIEEEMLRRGLSSARAAQIAALDTREAKDLAVAPERLRADWRARAAEHGLTRESLRRLFDRASVRQPATSDLAREGRRLSGPDGLTARVSTFDRRDAVQAWAATLVHALPDRVERLADRWLASRHAVQLEPAQAPGYCSKHTTPGLLATEQRLRRHVRSRRSQGCAAVSAPRVEAALACRSSLSDEQASLVRAICCSGNGVDVVRGLAGTGKTFALGAAREAYRLEGLRVIGCALQGKAALLLEEEAGIPSWTVASLLGQLRDGEPLGAETVLVVDEAGMVGTRQLAELVDRASDQGAKVVLIGDEGQLPELEAGGAFGDLARRDRTAELRRVRRQRDPRDVADLRLVREGQGLEAIRSMHRRGRVVIGADADDTRRRMVAAWREAHDRSARDGPAVMLARRHRDVRELNALARRALSADGRLGREVRLGDRAFAPGDRVIAGRNRPSLGVRNGMLGTVLAVDERRGAVHVRSDDGRDLRLPFSYVTASRPDGLPQLDHGYALTTYRAQGSTWARSFVLGSQDMYREEAYTVLIGTGLRRRSFSPGATCRRTRRQLTTRSWLWVPRSDVRGRSYPQSRSPEGERCRVPQRGRCPAASRRSADGSSAKQRGGESVRRVLRQT
jgi:conjugative relaxase-like TrwC/TraI family protein